MQASNQHQFSKIPHADIPRSSFNRSCGLKTNFNGGDLVPIFCDEALPGDTFNLRMSTFARMATPLHPVLDNMHLDSFFFAVPIRLLWDDWEKFNGAQINPGDSTVFEVPTIVSPGTAGAYGKRSDHLGIPPQAIDYESSALWHLAYSLIWNEWFRDENLQNSVPVDTGGGEVTYLDYAELYKRGKRHDYFSSSLPWPQKGTAVLVPIGSTAPIIADPAFPTPEFGTNTTNGIKLHVKSSNNDELFTDFDTNETGDLYFTVSGLIADLTNAAGATVNQLRESFAIQKLYERDARGGTRYPEILKAHFGVTSPDARLQRPEYLGGGTQAINIAPIPATTQQGTTEIGLLGGVGTSSGSNHSFTKSFVEHCIIIGMVSVRADLTYSQGVNRMFNRSTRWDFYWPALAHIGEQEVLSKEIYADGTANDELVWGYQERWAEYRYKPSECSNLMRPNAPASLATWHLGLDFASTRPTLSATFIQDDPPIDRVLAVTGVSTPQFLFDAYFDLKCARPMPTYSVPGLIDHF